MMTLRRVVVSTVLSWLLGQGIVNAVGCGPLMREIDSVNEPSDDVALKDCRQRAREAKEAGASKYRAYNVYEDCTIEAGIR